MPGRDGQDVGIKDDVLRRKADLLGEQSVDALADPDFVVRFGRLPLFVEGHHHDRGAVPADQAGLVQEILFAVLQADRVDDRLALARTSSPASMIDHFELSIITGTALISVSPAIRFRESRHRGLAVEQRIVHVDVDDAGAVGDLLAGDVDGLLEFVVADQSGELAGSPSRSSARRSW